MGKKRQKHESGSAKPHVPISQFLLYQTDDGRIRIKTRMENETIWLSMSQIAELFQVEHYSLDAIISVGYRINSIWGTQFRIWATERLKEYLVKGFAMDDERLKQTGGGSYFEELLARIRDIRSSEKIFWRKVLDIYATSIDYDPCAPDSTLLFSAVQKRCIGRRMAGRLPRSFISGPMLKSRIWG